MCKYLFTIGSFCLFTLHLSSQIPSFSIDHTGNKYKCSAKVNSESDLAKFASATHQDKGILLKKNKLTIDKVKGQTLTSVIDIKYLAKSKGKDALPVIYSVKKGENLLKVAQSFDLSLAQVKSENNLKTDKVVVGQKLKVGYLSANGKSEKITDKDAKKVIATDLKKEQKVNKAKEDKIVVIKRDTMNKATLVDADLLNKKYQNAKGVAYWQQGHRNTRSKYALHNSAPINSTILLYNPMIKKSVAAKVVGRIPEESYNQDVDIVISPSAALALGAKDARFSVEMKYLLK